MAGTIAGEWGEGDTVLEGRFCCVRVIKRGPGGETSVATDLQHGGMVVIKRVAVTDSPCDAQVRLEHEAEVLRRLGTGKSAPPIVVARDGASFYLVQPYIPGMTLECRLRRGPMSVMSTLRVGIDLLSILEHIHDHQVLHRDVKPANVIVDEGEPVERAVLIDYGFARSGLLESSVADEPVGTARYLA